MTHYLSASVRIGLYTSFHILGFLRVDDIYYELERNELIAPQKPYFSEEHVSTGERLQTAEAPSPLPI